MDLNELPPEFDYNFLDVSDANPLYCTQAIVGEGAVHDIEHVPNQEPAAVSDDTVSVGNNLADVGNNLAENT
jgi:hypothetical protein